MDRSTTRDRITASAFDLLLWEDHSARLKQLAARLIWSYGSPDAFRSAVGGPDAAAAMHGSGAQECSRPGYYLLVAQKNNGPITQNEI